MLRQIRSVSCAAARRCSRGGAAGLPAGLRAARHLGGVGGPGPASARPVPTRIADCPSSRSARPDGWQEVPAGLAETGGWRSPDSSEQTWSGPGSAGLVPGVLATGGTWPIPNTYPDPLPALTTGGTQPDPFGAAVAGLDGTRSTPTRSRGPRGLPGVAAAGVLVDQTLAERTAVGRPTDQYEVWCAPGAAERVVTELEAAGIPVTGQQRAADLALTVRRAGSGPGAAAAARGRGRGGRARHRRDRDRAVCDQPAARLRAGRAGDGRREPAVAAASGCCSNMRAVLGTAAGGRATGRAERRPGRSCRRCRLSRSAGHAAAAVPAGPGTVAIAAGAALTLAAIAAVVMTEATARADARRAAPRGPGLGGASRATRPRRRPSLCRLCGAHAGRDRLRDHAGRDRLDRVVGRLTDRSPGRTACRRRRACGPAGRSGRCRRARPSRPGSPAPW